MYDFQTSYPAYKEPKEKTEMIVLNAIRQLKECCDREIKKFTGLEINQVSGRRNKLMNEGVIYCSRVDKYPETGRTVNYWREKKN